MPPLVIISLCAVGWVALVLALRALVLRLARDAPGAHPLIAIIWRLIRVHCRIVHRTRYEGLEHVPQTNRPGALIVVSNHTSGVDPLLIQAACPFLIRYMMAREFMAPELGWFWKLVQIIPVDRAGQDAAALRAAMRHLKSGGALGIFPEGRIVEPRGEVRPFMTGVGLIAARSGARVMLVWVNDTPQVESTAAALFIPSRSRVKFIGVIDFKGSDDADAITQELRRRLAEASGWRINDEPMPPLERPGVQGMSV